MDLSIRIATWMRAKGRTQAQMAVALGVRPSAVSMWITGKAKPTDKHREALAEWLGITLPEFYGDLPDVAA